MAVSFVAAGAVAGGVNPTVAVPAGFIQGDLLLITVTGSSTVATPAGWTQTRSQGGQMYVVILSKIATGTETAVALTNLTGANSIAVMLAYRGASAVDVTSGYVYKPTLSLGPITTSSQTTNTYANELQVSVFAATNTGGNWTAPGSPTTTRVNASSNTTSNGLLIVDETQAAAGLSTIRSATIDVLTQLTGFTFSIIPSGRYWVGGTGTWDATTTNWAFSSGGASGAPAPKVSDSVTFDQAGTYTVTMTGALTCFGMTVSASAPTFTSTGTLTNSGSMSLDAGTVWSATGLLTFNSTTSGRTVTANTVAISSPITFNGVGGAWTLGSALTTGAAVTTTLTNGSLLLNGFNLTTGSFSSNNTNIRAIAWGTNSIYLTHTTAAQTVLDMAVLTNYSSTGSPSFVSDASVTRTYTFGTTGGTSAKSPDLALTGSGTAVQTFTTGSWFGLLNFGTTAFNPGTTALNLDGLTLSSGGTFTTLTPTMVGTGTIISNGKPLPTLTINSISGTTTLGDALTTVNTATTTLTSGTLALASFTLTTGIFSSSNTTIRAIAFDTGNIVLAHPTAATTVLNMAIVTNLTTTATTGGFVTAASITRTFTFGTTSGTSINAPNLAITSGAAIPTITTNSWFNTLDFTGSTCTPAATTVNVSTLTLASGGTYTALIPSFTRTQTWTSQFSKQLGGMVFNLSGGTLTLDGTPTFVPTAAFTLTAGTLNLTGDLTIGTFSSTNTNTRSITFGTSSIILSTTTAAATNLNMATATGFSCTGTGGFNAAANITRSFTFGTTGGTSANAPNLTFTTGTAIQTLTTASYFNKLDFGTTAFVLPGTGLNVNDLVLSTGGTYTSLTPTMVGSGTIVSNGKPISGLVINTLSTFYLPSNLPFGAATSSINLNSGTFDLNGRDLTIGSFTASSTLARSIAFGTNKIILATTAAGTNVLSVANASNFTYTGTGQFESDASVTRSYIFGTSGTAPTAANAPKIKLTGTGAGIATFSTGSWFNTLDFGTTAFAVPTTSVNVSTIILNTGGTYTGLTIVGIGTGSVTTAGKTIAALTVNSTAITTLNDALTTVVTGTTTLTSGTLNLNDFTLTTGIFNTNGIIVRSIAFGTGNIVLTHTTVAVVVLEVSDATNFSYTGTGGFVTGMNVTRTLRFGYIAGGSSTNAPNLSITSGAEVPTFTNGSWFNTLNFTGSTCTPAMSAITLGIYVSTLTLATGGTYTGLIPVFTRTQTWSSQFSKQLGGIGFNLGSGTLTLDGTQTYTATSIFLLVLGTLDLGSSDLTIGTFSSTNTNTRSISFGSNNIILATTTAAAVNLNIATATNFTYIGTGGFVAAADITRTFTFGTTGGTTNNSPNLTFTTGVAIQTLTSSSWFNKLDFGTTAFNPGTTTLNLDSLALSSAAGVYTTMTINMVGTGTIKSNGNATLAILNINSVSGTTTLVDAFSLTAGGTTTLTTGILDLGGFTLTTGVFSSTNTNERSIIFGSTNIVLTNTIAGNSALVMAIATNFTYTGTGAFTSAMTTSRRFDFGRSGGATLTNAPNLSITSGASEVLMYTGSYFKTVDYTGSTSTVAGSSTGVTGSFNTQSLILGDGTYTLMTINMVGMSTINGNSKSIAALTINHDSTTSLVGTVTVVGTTTFGATLAPTLDLNGYDLTTGSFASSYNTVRSIIFGTNYIVTTTAGIDMPIADNFTYTGTGGFKGSMGVAQSFNFGSTSGADTSNAINLFVASGSAPFDSVNNSWFKKLDFTGSTGTSAPAIINVNELILSSSGTYLALTANMFGPASTISGNGKSVNTFTIPTTGTTTLLSALGVNAHTQLINTTLDLAGFAFTSLGVINYNGGVILNFGNISCTTFTLNGPTLVLDSGSINCSISFVINSGSYTLAALGSMGPTPLFTHTSGDVIFGKDYSLTTTGIYALTSGTLDLGGFTLTTGIFSSSNANTRAIAFGSGSIVLTNTVTNINCLSMADATNFSYTGIGGFVAAADIVGRRFDFGRTAGGTDSNAPNLSITSGSNEILFFSTSWFNKLDLTGSTCIVSGSATGTLVTLNLKSLTLGGAASYANLTANIVDTGTINGNGKSMFVLVVNHIGTTTFTGSLTVSGTYTQTSGDIDFGTYNLTCAGAIAYTSGTYANTGIISCTTFTVNGNFTLTNGTLTPSTSFILASGTFEYVGGTLSPAPAFIHTSGVATFSKAYALTATGTYTLTAGYIVLNGYNLTTGIFSSSNANIREISFGLNDIILATSTAAAVNLNMSTATNFSCTGIGGFRAAADITRTFAFGNTIGGTTANAPNLTFTTGAAVQTLTTASWFNSLNFGTTSFNPGTTTLNLTTLLLSINGTYTALSPNMIGTGTINTAGKTIGSFTVNTLGTVTLASNIQCANYFQLDGFIDYQTYTINSTGAMSYTGGTLTDATITCASVTISTGVFSFISGVINTPTFTVASGTFNYVGGDLSSVTNFTHTSGTVNMTSDLTLAPNSTYTFTAGTLAMNDFTLSTGIFSSTGIIARSILFGTGNIMLTHTTAAQTVLSMADATNFNYTGTGGFRTTADVTKTFTVGSTLGANFNNAPSLAITSGSAVPTITTNSWFKVLDFTGSTCTPAATTVNIDTLLLDATGTYTGLIPCFTRTQTWTSQHSKQLGGIGVNRLFTTVTLDGTQTYTATSVCSVIAGTLDLGGYDLTIGSFISSGTSIRSVVFKNTNIILNTTTAGAVLSVADATNFSYTSISGGFVSDATIARTYQFGSTLGASTANAPNLLINSGTAIPSITTNSWFNTLDFTGSSCTPAATVVNVNNLTLSSGGTFTGISATMRSNGIITPNGKSIAALVINHTDLGTTSLAGALTCTTHTYTTGNIDFNNFNLTGTVAIYSSGSFSNINVFVCTSFNIAGNFVLDNGIITPSSAITLNSGSLTYLGGTISPVATFNHNAGTVTLGKSYALTVNGTYTLTAGSLNLNNYNLSTGIFSSTGIVARSIEFGTGNITLTHTTVATTVLSMAVVTNFTTSGTGGFVTAASITRTFTFGTTGGSETNAVSLAITSGSAVPTITTNSWFNKLDFTGSTCAPIAAAAYVNTLILATGGDYTGLVARFTRTQTWSMQYGKQLGGMGFNLAGGTLTLDGTQTFPAISSFLLQAGKLNLGGYDFSIGTFSANSTAELIAFGTNNIVLTTTATLVTALNFGNATNFTCTGTGGFVIPADRERTFVFGTTGGTSANAPNLTFTGSGTAIQTLTTGSWFNKLDFGTTAFSPSVTTLNLNGLTLSSGGGSYTALIVNLVGSGIIIGNGTASLGGLTINHSATTTLGGNFAVNYVLNCSVTLTSGTLALAGYTLTTAAFISTNTNTRSIAFGTGNIVLSVPSGSAVLNLDMADATNFTCTGTGGFTSAMSVDRTFTFGSTTGGSVSNAPNLSITSGAAIPTITSGSWFNALNFTGSTCTPAATTVNVSTLTLATAGTYTGLTPLFTRTQTWTSQYSKTLAGIGFNLIDGTLTLDGTQTYSATGSFSLVAGTLNLGGVNQTFGRFISNTTDTRSIAFGTNNIILATTTAAVVNLSMPTATNFSYTGTGGFTSAMSVARTFNFGSTAGGTSVNAPNLSLTSGASIPTFISGSWFNTLNFTGSSSTPDVATLNLNSLTLPGTGTYTNLTVNMVGNGTINGNSKTIGALTVNSNNPNTTEQYKVVTFNSSGSITFPASNAPPTVEYLVVGGGGGGGGGAQRGGGGGGAGGLVAGTSSITSGISYPVTVGSGGAATVIADSAGAVGTASSFSGVTGNGGGGGGYQDINGPTTGACGGGGSQNGNQAGAAGNQGYGGGQGFDGGTPGPWRGGGGGGMGAIGDNGSVGGAGGVGLLNSISGTSSYYAGGGGGGAQSTSAGAGGNGGGGAGGSDSNGSNGTANKGGGGGGGGFNGGTGLGGGGGSGLVSIRYLATYADPTSTTGSPAVYTIAVPLVAVTQTTSDIVTLSSALFVTGTTTLTFGKINLNNFTLSTSSFISSNTNVRAIDFGSGNIAISTAAAAGTAVLSMADATNFTCTGTGGFTSALSVAQTFRFGSTAGGSSTKAPNLSIYSGTAIPTIITNSWFNTLNFTGSSSTPAVTTVNVNSIILATGGTYTNLTVNMVGTGTITSNGKTIAALNINSNNPDVLVPYKVYTFNSSGSITFPASNAPPTVEYLVAAGGGGGGGGIGAGGGGGGGGAGGLILSSASIVPGSSYSIAVGSGGIAATGISGTSGSISSFHDSIAIGGGYGGQRVPGGAGGSGGGGGGGLGTRIGGLGTAGQGNNGGAAAAAGPANADSSGGGGGAGFAAADAVATVASSGGDGLSSVIAGTETYYAGGGGGGGNTTPGAGGNGGGGAGGGNLQNGSAGTSNTGGGGGGGGGGNTSGGAGGSGVVIISYMSVYADPSSTTGSPNVSTIIAIPLIASSPDIVTLSGALTVTGVTSLTLGKLNLNNFTLTTAGFSSSNTNVRVLAFGTGNIALTSTTASTTVLSMDDATNFSYTGTGGFTSAMSVTRTFTFGSTAGGSIFNAMNLSLTSGASTITLTSGSWFKVLAVTGTTSTIAATTLYVDTLTLATGGTYTGLTPVFTRTQIWTMQFAKQLAGIGVNSVDATLTLDGTQTYATTSKLLLTAGTLDLGGSNVTFGSVVSSNNNARAIVFGSNNITLATTVADTEVLSMADATNFTCTGTGGFTAGMNVTRTFSFGSTTGGSATSAPNLSITSGANLLTISNGSWFRVLDFTGSTSEIIPTTLNVDTLTLATGGTYTSLTSVFTRTQTWTSQFSKVLSGIGVNKAGATLTLDGTQTLAVMSNIVVNAGTLNLAGYDISCYNFSSTGTGSRVITGASAITVTNNWSVINGTGLDTSGCTINMVAQATKTFAGAGGTYGTLVQKSKYPLLITGSNSFESVQVSSDMVEFVTAMIPIGEMSYTTPGTYTWTAPAYVTSVSVVTVGGGGSGGIGSTGGAMGGGGGALAWKNNISVTPGQSYTVVVGAGGAAQVNQSSSNTGFSGGDSYFLSTTTVRAGGGTGGNCSGTLVPGGAVLAGDGGGAGGRVSFIWGGAGGAGGYNGNSGTGGQGGDSSGLSAGAGQNGGGGGGNGTTSVGNGTGSGGGVGIMGLGANGSAASSGITSASGSPGSGGSGKLYGGGGNGLYTFGGNSGPGGDGAVRIIWGYKRSFPVDTPVTVDMMIVGGGGGSQIGAGDANSGIGGGGGGGVVLTTYTIPQSVIVSQTAIVVTVGTGGYNSNGSNSTVAAADNTFSLTALGGGASGTFQVNGTAGGSGGGGGGRDYPPGTGGTGLQPTSASGGYGNNGGNCRTGNEGGGTSAGGGGGGAGAVGGYGVSQLGGVGGVGIASTLIGASIALTLGVGEISGSSVYFAGGGGGMANGSGGAGGLGGGAVGASSTYQGSGSAASTQSNSTGVRNGKTNTGGGAGGAAAGYTYGGTGGSGIVIIRQLLTTSPPAAATGGCTVVYDGLYILYIFKSSGTITL